MEHKFISQLTTFSGVQNKEQIEIMKDTRASKLDALNMLFSRYESQKRLEEAVRVRRIIDKVESNAEGKENGMRQDT